MSWNGALRGPALEFSSAESIARTPKLSLGFYDFKTQQGWEHRLCPAPACSRRRSRRLPYGRGTPNQVQFHLPFTHKPALASTKELENTDIFLSFIVQGKNDFSSQRACCRVILGYTRKAHQSEITEIQCMNQSTTENNHHNVHLLCARNKLIKPWWYSFECKRR